MLLRVVGKTDKRLKQLVKEFGHIWRFKKYSHSAQCLGNMPGYYAQSMDEIHIRWIEAEFIEEIPDVETEINVS